MDSKEKSESPTPWVIRSTTHRDRPSVAKLLSNAPEKHLHLDWYSIHDLLEESPSLLALEGDQEVAVLACPPDPPEISWIRYFVVREGSPKELLWRSLWERTLAIAPSHSISIVSALVTQSWFIPLLKQAGFKTTTDVIFLEWKGQEIIIDLPGQATLRKMKRDDLEVVAQVDQRAFPPLWQHSLRALVAAYELSSFATVMEINEQIVAYQISTSSALGAHLARLAVEPAMQAQGFATALVNHAITHFQRRGIYRMSVNTQSDNERSQILYGKVGFTPTGQRFPVYSYEL